MASVCHKHLQLSLVWFGFVFFFSCFAHAEWASEHEFDRSLGCSVRSLNYYYEFFIRFSKPWTISFSFVFSLLPPPLTTETIALFLIFVFDVVFLPFSRNTTRKNELRITFGLIKIKPRARVRALCNHQFTFFTHWDERVPLNIRMTCKRWSSTQSNRNYYVLIQSWWKIERNDIGPLSAVAVDDGLFLNEFAFNADKAAFPNLFERLYGHKCIHHDLTIEKNRQPEKMCTHYTNWTNKTKRILRLNGTTHSVAIEIEIQNSAVAISLVSIQSPFPPYDNNDGDAIVIIEPLLTCVLTQKKVNNKKSKQCVSYRTQLFGENKNKMQISYISSVFSLVVGVVAV